MKPSLFFILFSFIFGNLCSQQTDIYFEDEATVQINFKTPSATGVDRGLIKLRITPETTGVVYRVNGNTLPYTEFPTTTLQAVVEKLFNSINSSGSVGDEEITIQIRSNTQNIRYTSFDSSPIEQFVKDIEQEYYLALFKAMEKDLRAINGTSQNETIYILSDGALTPPLYPFMVNDRFLVETKESLFSKDANYFEIVSIDRQANAVDLVIKENRNASQQYLFEVDQFGDKFRVETVKRWP